MIPRPSPRDMLAAALGAGPLLLAPASWANNGGIPGYSGNPAHNGGQICNLCHSGGVAPSVALTGPSEVDGGETETYTVTISGGQATECGFGASASAGELSVAEPGTQIFNGDATHAGPRPVDGSGKCTFRFDWTAPFASGDVTLSAAGNSVDGNAQTAGDRAAADSLVVSVDGAPPGMIPPIADADGPHTAVLGDAIPFDGTGSSDADGSVVEWEWDFDDGETGSGPQPSHSYDEDGSYEVMLTVTDDDGFTDTDTTTATVLAQPGGFTVERVVASSLLRNAAFVTAPEGDARLFVVVQGGIGPTPTIGKIYIIDANDQILTPPFLQIPIGITSAESGLRGLRFAPDYATSGSFYVIYTDANGDTVLSRFQVSAGNPDLADPDSEVEIMLIPQPHTVHNTSHMQFGPDGRFYVAVADGGVQTNGQDTSNFLGAFLRLDLAAGPGYTVPPDNPFVGPGNPVDEIYAYGFRNPYVFDFDPETGDLYIADVGATEREEMDAGSLADFAGGNYGWALMEGTRCNTSNTALCQSGLLRLPIHEYTLEDGRCSIIGGVVYRGVIPSLQGRFLFADFCSAQIWSLLWDGAGGVVDVAEHTAEMAPDVGEISNISAIQRDGAGELVILDRTQGEVFRVVPEPSRTALVLAGAVALLGLRRLRRRDPARSGDPSRPGFVLPILTGQGGGKSATRASR